MTKKINLPEKDIIKKFLKYKLSINEISNYYGCSSSVISRILSENFIECGQFLNHWTQEEDNILIEHYVNDKSNEEIIDLLKNERTWPAIVIRARRLKLPFRTVNYRKYTFDHTYFKEIDTEEKAYWLGFMYADGNVKKNKYGIPYTVRLSLVNEAEKHITKLANAINFSGKIAGPYYSKRKNKNGNKSKYFSIELHSKELSADIVKHGVIPAKTFHVKFPKIKHKLIKHFVRGLFDGDGCITEAKRILKGVTYCQPGFSISGAVPEFLEKISLEISKSCDVNTTNAIKHINERSTYHIGYFGSSAIKIRDWMYSGASVYMEYKREKFFSFDYPKNKSKDKKYQENEIDKELSSRGWKRLSQYNGYNKDITLKCNNDHIFTTKVENYKKFIYKLKKGIAPETQGCPYCVYDKRRKKQLDIGRKNFEILLKIKGWKLLSEYNSDGEIILKCEHDKEFVRKRKTLSSSKNPCCDCINNGNLVE